MIDLNSPEVAALFWPLPCDDCEQVECQCEVEEYNLVEDTKLW